jgi:outer membrane protein assembly factor BamB
MHHAPTRRTLALTASGLLLVLAAAPAADWPRFRGPNGTGVAADAAIPVRFKEGDGVLWKMPLPGKGNSSPIVSHGKLFIESASTDGSQRFLLCLDAASGKTAWERSMPGAKAKTHQLNTLASSTPAADGERVYALFWDGHAMTLAAYDFQGNLQWKQDLGPFQSQHGAGTSPVVYDGRVFVNYDQDGAAAALAFDAKSGKPLWRVERKAYRACYSAPILRDTPAGGKELVVVSTASITAYDPASGAVSWNWEWDWSNTNQPLRTVATPVVWKDLVFAQGGEGPSANSYVVAIRVGSPGNPPKLVWQKKKGSFPYVPSLLVADGRLYTVHDKTGIAGCYDAATGKEIWTNRLSGEFKSSPVLVNGTVYLTNEEGVVYVYPAAPAFKLLARNPLGERVIATPAVADGRMYIRGANDLFCIGKQG